MALDAKTNFVGIVTATGEVMSEAGALRIADNVTLRKEGALTLRGPVGATPLAYAYAGAFPYKGSLYYVTSGTAPVYYGPLQTSLTVYPDGVTLSAVRSDVQTMKEARGNLYFPAAEGVFKVSATTDAALYDTGANATAIVATTVNATGSNDLLAANQHVAYRVVTVQTDPNGVIRRSRPSGAVVVRTTVGGSPFLVVSYAAYIAGTADITRSVEVYRTRVFPTTAQVDDEMQLVYTFTSPNAGTTSTFFFEDKLPDASRGVTLYTSPSRGGIEAANDRPPGCACLERYRTSLFFGNTVGPHRYTVSYKTATANLVGSATGVGARQTTGTTTAGGNTITSVANTTGLQVGMVAFTNVSNTFVGQITNIAGSTVTVSAPTPMAATGGVVIFYDAVLVNGTAIMLGGGTYNAYKSSSGWFQNHSPLRTSFITYELTPAAAGYDQTLVIERIRRGGAAFTVSATHGDELSPALPLPTSGNTLPSKNDVFPHGLAWSEPDEPEHTPIKNFARVGDAGRAILALVATKDRLLIFKEDGLYMLTGNTARDFGIYPLDTTALCILPGSVRRMQNTVFFLANLGLAAVDESGGVQIVGRPIQNELAPIITQIRQTARANGGQYFMPGLAGVTGTSDDANGEYWLALGTTTPSFGGQVLVFNAFRQGFTTYSFGASTPSAVAQDGEGLPLVLTDSVRLTPLTGLGAITAITARVSPHAFSDPALAGRLWTHIVAGFSRLTGTTSVTARFSSSESMVDGTTIDEVLEASASGGLVQLPGGSLLRHPVPRAMARAFLAFVELVIAVSTGTFTLELVGSESRENIPNKRPSHGTGTT